MEIGLTHLIDKRSAAYVEESRTLNAAVQVAAGDQPQPDPATPEGPQAGPARTKQITRSGQLSAAALSCKAGLTTLLATARANGNCAVSPASAW